MANSEKFEPPVVLLTGLGHIHSHLVIHCGLHVSGEWPVSERDASHRLVMETCLASIRTEVESSLTRALFLSWSDQSAIHAPDATAFFPGRCQSLGSLLDTHSDFVAAEHC